MPDAYRLALVATAISVVLALLAAAEADEFVLVMIGTTLGAVFLYRRNVPRFSREVERGPVADEFDYDYERDAPVYL
jgi:hypothetical protein